MKHVGRKGRPFQLFSECSTCMESLSWPFISRKIHHITLRGMRNTFWHVWPQAWCSAMYTNNVLAGLCIALHSFCQVLTATRPPCVSIHANPQITCIHRDILWEVVRQRYCSGHSIALLMWGKFTKWKILCEMALQREAPVMKCKRARWVVVTNHTDYLKSCCHKLKQFLYGAFSCDTMLVLLKEKTRRSSGGKKQWDEERKQGLDSS